MNEKTPETYDPSETIRLRIFKPEIGYDKYVDIMPSQMDNVKLLERQGFQVSRVASPKTSGTGAFLGGVLRGATFELEEEGYGLLGGDEVQLEAQKQRQREDIERPGAVLAGQVVGSLIGAPAKLAGAGTKAASKLGPMGARAIKSLLGAGEAAATGIAAKPMGEKSNLTWGDVFFTGVGALLGGILPPKMRVDKKSAQVLKNSIDDLEDEGRITVQQGDKLRMQLDDLAETTEIEWLDEAKLVKEIQETPGIPVFEYRQRGPRTSDFYKGLDKFRWDMVNHLKQVNPDAPPTITQLILDNTVLEKMPISMDQFAGKATFLNKDFISWGEALSNLLGKQKPNDLQMKKIINLTGIDQETVKKINLFYDKASDDLKKLGLSNVMLGPMPANQPPVGFRE